MIRIDLGKEDTDDLEIGNQQKGIQGKIMRQSGLEGSDTKQKILFVLIIGAGLFLASIPSQILSNYKVSVLAEYNQQQEKWNVGIRTLSSQIRKLNGFKTELDSYNKQKELTEKRIKAVRELLDIRSGPVNVLNTIGQQLPKRAWLKTISLNLEEGKKGVDLVGGAFSNEEISDYVDKLSDSVYLGGVKLNTVSPIKLKESELEVKEFGILAQPNALQFSSEEK